MARGRMLNKTISASRKFQDLPDDTCRLLATWIIPHLDMNGVFYAEPAMVKAFVFPRRTDITADQVEQYLDAIERAGLIYRFWANGDLWQCWPGFADNQVGLRRDRESTDYPTPPAELPQLAAGDAVTEPEDCRQEADELPAEVKRTEVKVKVKVREEEAGEAPGAAAPPVPVNLLEWRQHVKDSKNPTAAIAFMVQSLRPDYTEAINYGLIGATARTVGGWGRLVQLVWENANKVNGDIFRYCQQVAKANGTGPPRQPSERGEFADLIRK